MEILFPDVVGSGGAPKRITKPRRKGVEAMPDSDDLDTSGANVMSLLSPGSSSIPFPTSQTPIHPPTVPSNGTIRPSSTTMQNRPSIASSTALTPPDDEAPANNHTRKRFHPSNTVSGPSEKRRRTANNNYIDLTHSAQLMNMDNNLQDGGSIVPNAQIPANHQSNNAGPSSSGGPVGGSRNHLVQESMLALSEFVRGFRNAPAPPPPTPRWTEQAMEIFFRDFSDEDPDLQIKIGEKVLCDTNKATMFCTMPEQLRQHWVKRLREIHHRLDMSAGLNSSMNSNAAAAMNGNNGLMNGGGIAGMMQLGGPVNGGGMGRNGSQVG